MPQLSLDYFLPEDVYGDDAFTTEIEPTIPFTLGVRVNNNGGGWAADVAIDSAQPKIVDNDQGLLVNFVIQGSEVNGIVTNDSLLVNFGDIAPQTSGTARWLMSCNLSGKFIEFNATVSHADELGGELTSIIDSIGTHVLVHDVLVDLPGRDNVCDFLSRDGTLLNVYESNSLESVVTDQSAEANLQLISSGSDTSKYQLTLPAGSGFIYVELPDPRQGQQVIAELVRSDGKIIDLNNVWLSKSRDDNLEWQYFLHLFDADTTGGYTIVLQDPGARPQPPVLQYIPNRNGLEGQQVSFIVEASDPNGTIPQLTAAPLPPGATFVDQGDGTAIFDWATMVGQAGRYSIRYTASDGLLQTIQRAVLIICDIGDTDCDGMDDQWELDYFGTLDRDGTGDFDGDGISDLDEFLNGTDPADSLVVYLSKGYNLVTIPDAAAGENLKARIADLGDSQSIERIMVYDKLNDVYITMIPGDAGNPDYNLESGDALIVYALQDRDIFFESRTCEPFDLQVGFNLVGMTCAPYGYTARQFLQDIEADKVISIQRYNTEVGKFETVGFADDGVIQGADFSLVPGEGYFIAMKTAFNDYSFEAY